jgi:tetratricopeptide (TPR) repeat protein
MTEVSQASGTGPASTPPATPPLGMEEQKHLRKAQANTNKLLSGILLLLVVLVAAVIFMLPKYVSQRQAAAAASKPAAVAPSAPAATPAQTATPYEEAQRMKLREKAQQTLSDLLNVQGSLEKKQVARWAGSEFDSAVATAHKGDEAYANQRFDDANGLYESAASAMQAIISNEPALYAAQMKSADAAFQAGNAETAEQGYTLAVLIKPDSSEAANGAQRAHVLKDVLALLRDGKTQEAAGNLEVARDKYQQALSLDHANSDAARSLARMQGAIVDRNFAAAMSRGFAALQAGSPEKAQEAFRQADTIKPGAKEVKTAMQQAQDQQTFSAITVHVNNATQKEADENWSEALAAWDAALGVDPNLVAAQQGKQRATGRNNLDQYMIAIIKDPLRLADQGVFAQTTQVLADAGRLPSPGPKLQFQLSTVGKFVDQIRKPVAVQVQSDGQTAVTIYKVGELGLFTAKAVNLTPGAYVAVGVRKGYRDVRKEFTVSIDGQAPVVSVICTDTI